MTRLCARRGRAVFNRSAHSAGPGLKYGTSKALDFVGSVHCSIDLQATGNTSTVHECVRVSVQRCIRGAVRQWQGALRHLARTSLNRQAFATSDAKSMQNRDLEHQKWKARVQGRSKNHKPQATGEFWPNYTVLQTTGNTSFEVPRGTDNG